MFLPDITIRIRPAQAPNAIVKATWQSPDGTPRTIQKTVSVAQLDTFLGDMVHEMFDTIKRVEEELHG